MLRRILFIVVSVRVPVEGNTSRYGNNRASSSNRLCEFIPLETLHMRGARHNRIVRSLARISNVTPLLDA